MSKEGYSLWLVGGTALLMAETASPSWQYALDSLLFAQLRSDKLNGSRFANFTRWYSGYRTALEARGWIIPSSRSDYQPLKGNAPLAQRLTDDLQARHPSLSGYVQAAIATLSRDDVQQYLQPFTLLEQDQATHAVYELGVMLPDASLDLCAMAFKSTLPAAQIRPCTVLSPPPSDKADLRTTLATLGEQLTEADRQGLHALLERKQYAGRIRNLGVLRLEDSHANT
ncbi:MULTISPECIES: hypothetical protein [unclassified Pseudomonas]|jgi:hypothetical protein|uniref:hypothetical protein n=1 Tax=unclassified Pseudomonas TaxID=196821 RepID=UPI000A0CB723|nr:MULTISPECIES: hypothetical protein [unclassified Pseudomonas]SME95827.1 hypothetical protein SAMN02745962_00723 [Pseudomonas sp. LAIL14HWK12:I11]SMR68735.1 hypothetical protein SAMN05661028_00724 [Pseudomonas sp. LAIL14HWK12:I10]SOD00967.1 hypothetical protein SAMN05660296_00725 [Pseudomonas sp. LAIL14HWK12:I8]